MLSAVFQCCVPFSDGVAVTESAAWKRTSCIRFVLTVPTIERELCRGGYRSDGFDLVSLVGIGVETGRQSVQKPRGVWIEFADDGNRVVDYIARAERCDDARRLRVVRRADNDRHNRAAAGGVFGNVTVG